MNQRRPTRPSFTHVLALAAALAISQPPRAAAQLEWRVSVKVVRDANGNRSVGGELSTDAEIIAKIDAANAVLDVYGRGYRFTLSEPIVDLYNLPAPPNDADFCVGGDNDGSSCGGNADCPNGGVCTQLTHWFNTPINRDARNALSAAARADRDTFAWRDDAINIYIVGTAASGTTGDMILIGQALATPNTPLHEMGHYLNLCHTHGCEYGSSSPDCDTVGDDEVADTLLDNSCWDTQDQMAQGNWPGMNYTDLTAAQQQQVDDMLVNVMSYHIDRTKLTQGQLDRMTDSSNVLPNFNITNGRTRFVDRNNAGSQSGSSVHPYVTVAAGLAAADSGDIVLIRAGSYNEPQTINQRVYLRACRGNAVIGR